MTLPAMEGPTVPPFDPHARSRIEEVATAFIDLCGRLEDKIDAVAERLIEVERALDELRPRD